MRKGGRGPATQVHREQRVSPMLCCTKRRSTKGWRALLKVYLCHLLLGVLWVPWAKSLTRMTSLESNSNIQSLAQIKMKMYWNTCVVVNQDICMFAAWCRCRYAYHRRVLMAPTTKVQQDHNIRVVYFARLSSNNFLFVETGKIHTHWHSPAIHGRSIPLQKGVFSLSVSIWVGDFA